MENQTSDYFDVVWHDSGREPQCPSNPDYPDGIEIDVASREPSCIVTLAYPARRCGFYEVRCRLCSYSAIVTTAGRRDDPRSVRLPCQIAPGVKQ